MSRRRVAARSPGAHARTRAHTRRAIGSVCARSSLSDEVVGTAPRPRGGHAACLLEVRHDTCRIRISSLHYSESWSTLLLLIASFLEDGKSILIHGGWDPMATVRNGNDVSRKDLIDNEE